jgi:hypothetical protein
MLPFLELVVIEFVRKFSSRFCRRKAKFHRLAVAKARKVLRQHRAVTASRLCVRPACIFSVILHKSSLKYAGIPASNLYKLTKNPMAQSTHNHCAVLP